MKPLGHRSYGSIGHLHGSRIGPGDHMVHEGQSKIATKKLRDKHDVVIVQEKLDGTNVSIARIEGVITPLQRKGYLAISSPYLQHRFFASWVFDQLERFDFLQEGERLCGEWLAQAHGTRYALPHEPFVAFDLMQGHQRSLYDVFTTRAAGFVQARLLHRGGPCSIERAMDLQDASIHGALDPIEGAVWRIERQGAVDFLCKYVHPEKKDGLYLPGVACSVSEVEIWNWTPPGYQRRTES